jgi:hypothetical protein
LQDSTGNAIPQHHGELEVMFDDGNLFSVSGYKGKPSLGYVCVQVNQASFYHKGNITSNITGWELIVEIYNVIFPIIINFQLG